MGCVLVSAFCMHVYGVERGGGGETERTTERGVAAVGGESLAGGNNSEAEMNTF